MCKNMEVVTLLTLGKAWEQKSISPVGSNSSEKILKYLGSLLTNQNSVHEEMKCRLKEGKWYYSV